MPIIHEQQSLAVGGLANAAGILQSSKLDGSQRQGKLMKKTYGRVTWSGKTDDQGPVLYGVTHTLSAAELAEALVADPQGQDDPTTSDAANRPIILWGVIPADGVEIPASVDLSYRRYKMFSWKIREGVSLQYFAFNTSGGTLTTGLVIRFLMTHVYTWLQD